MATRFRNASIIRQVALILAGVFLFSLLLWTAWLILVARTAPLPAGRILDGTIGVILLPAAAGAFLLLRLSQRAAGALREMAHSADAVRREEAGALIARAAADAEIDQLSQALRRMVESMEGKRRQLELANRKLDENVRDRTRELDTLADIARDLTATSDENELTGAMLDRLNDAVSYESASLWGRQMSNDIVLLNYRYAGQKPDNTADREMIGKPLSSQHVRTFENIESSGKPVVANSTTRGLLSWLFEQFLGGRQSDQLYRAARSWMALPLLARDKVVGVLRVDHGQPGFFSAERERLLVAVSHQAGLAMQHARMVEESRQMAVVAERNRIARDLHDAVSQTLFAANVTASAIGRVMDHDPLEARAQLTGLEKLNQSALAELRMLLYELRPDALHDAGLADLMAQLAAGFRSRSTATITVNNEVSALLPVEVKTQIYRIAQEAVNNAVIHSNATQIEIEIVCLSPDRCLLRIGDNGHGFDPSAPAPGRLGLTSIRERAANIGAELDITSTSGAGTQVTVVWDISPGRDSR